MPAEFKYGRPEHRKHHSSSSSSPQHRDRNSSHRRDKWRKRSRSRSRSNQRQDSRHKTEFQHSHKDSYKYSHKPYEPRRESDYRKDDFKRRQPSEEKRDKYEYRKHNEKYPPHRYHEKQRERDYRRDERREKSSQNKRRYSSPSQSKSTSPKRNRQEPRHYEQKSHFAKRQEKKDNKDYLIRQKEAVYSKQNRVEQSFKKELKWQPPRPKEEKVNRGNQPEFKDFGEKEKAMDTKPKYMMKMPIPPPPPPHQFRRPNDYELRKEYREGPREEFRRQNRREHKDQHSLRDDHGLKKVQLGYQKGEKRQSFPTKTSKEAFKEEFQKLSPIKRSNEQRRQQKLQEEEPEVEKVRVSRFQMILNQAKLNLTFPTPPVSFMALQTFRHMNKFQVETLDQRWSQELKNQLEKTPDLRVRLPSALTEVESSQPRLWNFLKQERNEEELELKLRMQELKLHNTTICQLTRRLKVIE